MSGQSDPTGSSAPNPGTPGGHPTPEQLIDIDALQAAFHDDQPDPDNSAQRVAFGTSGHRGSALDTTFNDDHIAAITQAIVEFRMKEGIGGPVILGKDTHASSGQAERTAVEVLSVASKAHVDIREWKREANMG